MITIEQFDKIKHNFSNYLQSFLPNDVLTQQNFYVKTLHSLKVVAMIVEIGRKLNLNTDKLRLSQTVALLHDIGRFQQYQNYRTFSDKLSVNHGELGVEVLIKNGFLEDLSEYTHGLICFAVANHNAKYLPLYNNEEYMFYAKLVRDADKLDIFRVVSEYYEEIKNGNTNRTVGLDLPNTDEISPKIIDNFINGDLLDMADLKTLNDFKVLQISWLYDINFPESFKIIRDNKYIEMIISTFPHNVAAEKVRDHAIKYVEQKVISLNNQ